MGSERVMLALTAACMAVSFSVRAQECVPACRSGYICHEGTCIEKCNPPCPEGERCTDDARCVPIAHTPAAPSEHQPPTYSSPQQSPPMVDEPAEPWVPGNIAMPPRKSFWERLTERHELRLELPKVSDPQLQRQLDSCLARDRTAGACGLYFYGANRPELFEKYPPGESGGIYHGQADGWYFGPVTAGLMGLLFIGPVYDAIDITAGLVRRGRGHKRRAWQAFKHLMASWVLPTTVAALLPLPDEIKGDVVFMTYYIGGSVIGTGYGLLQNFRMRGHNMALYHYLRDPAQ